MNLFFKSCTLKEGKKQKAEKKLFEKYNILLSKLTLTRKSIKERKGKKYRKSVKLREKKIYRLLD